MVNAKPRATRIQKHCKVYDLSTASIPYGHVHCSGGAGDGARCVVLSIYCFAVDFQNDITGLQSQTPGGVDRRRTDTSSSPRVTAGRRVGGLRSWCRGGGLVRRLWRRCRYPVRWRWDGRLTLHCILCLAMRTLVSWNGIKSPPPLSHTAKRHESNVMLKNRFILLFLSMSGE